MWQRINVVGLSAVLLMVACTAVAWAAEPHTGKITSVQKDKVMILDIADGESETFLVNAETKITRDGKSAKVSELGIGDRVKIEADTIDGKLVAKTIEAKTAE